MRCSGVVQNKSLKFSSNPIDNPSHPSVNIVMISSVMKHGFVMTVNRGGQSCFVIRASFPVVLRSHFSLFGNGVAREIVKEDTCAIR